MLDRTIAENIYRIASDEIIKQGHSGVNTITMMKLELEKVGIDYSDYFYAEDNKMYFNLKRWERHFLT